MRYSKFLRRNAEQELDSKSSPLDVSVLKQWGSKEDFLVIRMVVSSRLSWSC